MIKINYDSKRNLIIIEFSGEIDLAQGEQSYQDVQKVVPKARKGFKLLTDLSGVKKMDLEVRMTIKKSMDFFNQNGVTEIIRVVPDPEQDIGFGIMSLFHYSKKVRIVTLESREEAEERLMASL